jgi:hypothetical protein
MITLIAKGLIFGLVLFLFSQFCLMGPSEAMTGCAFSMFLGAVIRHL